jgi:hypothetical protein
MNLNEAVSKWQEVLDFEEVQPIKDKWKRKVTAQLLENQQEALANSSEALRCIQESAPTNATGGGVANWDPILISLVRRAMPNLIAYDVCGVQPMSGPTGLIFALRSRYAGQTGAEALFDEAASSFSANNAGNTGPTGIVHDGTDPVGDGTTGSGYGFPNVNAGQKLAPGYLTGQAMSTATAEALGDGTSGNNFNEMAFSIEKVTVTAGSRALKAEYTIEIAQDLKAVHGLDAESELANILSAEILTEINREVIRNLYYIAKIGCASGQTASAGIFDLDVDSNGRWSVEKFKGLLFQLERDANQIAKQTRRGRGNLVICSSDVASALTMAGVLDYAPAMSTNLTVDDTGNTFAGILNGRLRVYIDPYYLSSGTDELAMVGYRGPSPYDAGFFYCPYVPLQMVRAVDPQSFQPKIGFKTRYGKVENPFYSAANGNLTAYSNPYYRIMKVKNLM